MTGTNTASQVPGRYDVIIDGYGYVFWNALMQSMPFRNQRAAYAFSPTFLERTNVSGKYGDDEQDFFLTPSQNDWTLGEGQFYFRGNDADRSRRYFTGVAVDTTTAPGRVAMRPATILVNPTGSSVLAMCNGNSSDFTTNYYSSVDSGTPTLHSITPSGSDSSLGAHGAGTVNRWGMCSDGYAIYIAGSSKIRSYGGSFADFSAATNAGSIAFLNNALYSCDGSVLKTYDGTGAATTIFTWKNAFNTALTPLAQVPKITSFGGQLLIYWPYLTNGPELWIYDGTSTERIIKFPASMVGYDVKVINGVIYLSGLMSTEGSGVIGLVPVVYFYLNGTADELWRSSKPVPGNISLASPFCPALGEVGGKLVILDQASKRLLEYDPPTGAISNVTNLAVSGSYASSDLPMVSSAGTTILFDFDAGNSSTGNTLGVYPDMANFATTSSVTSSMVDFDNSLTKIMRGVKVEWTGGGSVDISYLIDGDPVSGSYTSLRTSAVSGTEYLLPAATTGRAISVRVTLNNSGGQPTLTRWYVRAAPIQQAYRRCQYIVDLTGRIDKGQLNDPVPLRDGSLSTLTGSQMASNLQTAISSQVPISITDRLGTYTGVFEQGPGVTELDEVRPGEYVGQLTTREV